MTRILLACSVAAAALLAPSGASAEECTVRQCCVYPYDGGWCVTPLPLPDGHQIEDVCVYPYDGGWCLSDVLP
jgi:hypothetical protein